MKRILPILVVLLSGCADLNLKTRADLRAPDSTTKAVQVGDRSAPAQVSASEDLDSQLRQLNGRIEEVDNHVSTLTISLENAKTQNASEKKESEAKLAAYEEALKKLEAQVLTLTEQVNKPKVVALPADPKTYLDEADELVKNKKFKEAIVAYQKYRDAAPRGDHYIDATYKLGISFQELGMKDEARAFYDEVVTKYPKSPEAKKAAKRLKKLK
jgi:TolA-binding protein